MKKILASIGVVGAVISPVFMAVSCGLKPKAAIDYSAITLEDMAAELQEERDLLEGDPTAADGTQIELVVRASEELMYKNIIAKFNSLGKGTIKLNTDSFSNGMNVYYSQKASAGQLEQLITADVNTVIESVQDGKWLGGISLNDIFSSTNKDIYDVTDTEISYENAGTTQFTSAHVAVSSNDHGVNFTAPLGYTASVLTMNTEMIDESKKIIAYVPMDTPDKAGSFLEQDGLEQVGEDDGYNSCDIEGIQDFIADAGTSVSSENEALAIEDERWIGVGPISMQQRIASVLYSCLADEPKNLGVFGAVLKEKFEDFILFAAADSTRYGRKLVDNGVITEAGFVSNLLTSDGAKESMSDEDLIKQLVFSGVSDPNEALTRTLWNSLGGYMGTQAGMLTGAKYANNVAIGVGGEVESVNKKYGMAVEKAKWANKWIYDAWDHMPSDNSAGLPSAGWTPTNDLNNYVRGEAFTTGQVKSLYLPYGSSSGDSISMTNGLSAKQRIVAKRFLKFIYQLGDEDIYQVQYDNSGTTVTQPVAQAIANNFVSSFNPLGQVQKEGFDEFLDYVGSGSKENPEYKTSEMFFNLGKSSVKDEDGMLQDAEEYKGVGGQVWKSVEGTYFDLLARNLWEFAQYYKTNQKDKWSYEIFQAEFVKIIDLWLEQWKK